MREKVNVKGDGMERLSAKKSILEAVQSRPTRCIRMCFSLKYTDSHTRINSVDVPFVLEGEKYRYPPIQCSRRQISEGVNGRHDLTRETSVFKTLL